MRLARIFDMFSDWTGEVPLTPCFSGVFGSQHEQNRFNGFLQAAETVETVPTVTRALFTQLKQGVNGRAVGSRRNICDYVRMPRHGSVRCSTGRIRGEEGAIDQSKSPILGHSPLYRAPEHNREPMRTPRKQRTKGTSP